MTDFTSDRVKRALAWIGDSEGDLKSAYNSFNNVELSPARNRYGKADAKEALDAAEEILPAARSIINKTAEIFQQYTN